MLVAPEPESFWLPNYCLWADEVPPELESLTEHLWPEACVATPLGTVKLGRAYVKLSTRELQTSLWNAFRSGPAHVIAGRATRLDHRVSARPGFTSRMARPIVLGSWSMRPGPRPALSGASTAVPQRFKPHTG